MIRFILSGFNRLLRIAKIRRKRCVLSANCQGDVLMRMFRQHPVFLKEWDARHYVNFHKTPIPAGKIENCDLLLYQKLDDSWGDLSTKVLLSRLPKHAKAICFPNITNFDLWPTAKWAPDGNNLWLDTYVESLIEKGLELSEIVDIAMRADFSEILDLEAKKQEDMQREYEKEYFGRSKILEFIKNRWTEERLFTTPNHPAHSLLFLVANIILQELGYQILRPEVNAPLVTCGSDYFLPVHPFFIKHYNIKYLTEETIYPVFGNDLTYKEYLMAYVDARKNNIPMLSYFEALKK